MLKITDAERAYFDEMRCLTTDSEGREVLVGLTSEEINTYLALSGNLAAGASDPDSSTVLRNSGRLGCCMRPFFQRFFDLMIDDVVDGIECLTTDPRDWL